MQSELCPGSLSCSDQFHLPLHALGGRSWKDVLASPALPGRLIILPAQILSALVCRALTSTVCDEEEDEVAATNCDLPCFEKGFSLSTLGSLLFSP